MKFNFFQKNKILILLVGFLFLSLGCEQDLAGEAFNYLFDDEGNYVQLTVTAGEDEIILDWNAPGEGFVFEAPYSNFGEAPPAYFTWSQSVLQAFYFFNTVEINGVAIEPKDWVGAFNGETCVGSRLWGLCGDGSVMCDVPAMGAMNSDFLEELLDLMNSTNLTLEELEELLETDYTNGYLSNGQVPTFIIYDASEGLYYEGVPSEDISECSGFQSNMLCAVNSLTSTGNIYGCTNEAYTNYNSLATLSDGSCMNYFFNIYRDGNLIISGLTNSNYIDTGLNYSEEHCYTIEIIYGDGTTESSTEACIITNHTGIIGCTNLTANNYNQDATLDDGSCTYSSSEVSGCSDVSASNYDSDATIDDGSCEYENPIIHATTNPSEATMYSSSGGVYPTPFTIEVPPGTYTYNFTKSGFYDYVTSFSVDYEDEITFNVNFIQEESDIVPPTVTLLILNENNNINFPDETNLNLLVSIQDNYGISQTINSIFSVYYGNMIAYEFNGNVCSQSIDEDILNLDCSIDVTSIMENYGNGVYTLNVLVSDEAGNFVDTNEFIGSQFALTPNNYQGSLITSVNTGNSICESEIGLGSEWIEFHEQWGWGINGNLVNVNQAERVWVWINDQNAECFSTNNQYGMTWDVVTYDNKATCNSDIGLFGSEYNPQMVNQDYYNVDYDRKCNAYQGDTPCYMERPLLCKYANTYFTIEETFENITGDIGDNESELNANITFCHEFTGDCSSTVLENGIFDVSGLWNTHYYTKVSSTDFTIIFDVVDFGLIQESSDFFNINYVKFPQKRIIEDGVSALAKLSVSSGDSNLFKEFSQLTLNYDLNNLNPSIPIVIYKCEDSNWNDIDQTCEGGLIKISVEPDPIAKEITIMEGNFTVYLLTQEDTGDNGSTGDNGGTGNGAPPTNDSFNQEADSEMEEESEDALMEEDLEEEEGVDQLNQVDEEDNDLEESESQQGYTTEDNNNFLMIIIIILIIGFLAWLKFRKKKT